MNENIPKTKSVYTLKRWNVSISFIKHYLKSKSYANIVKFTLAPMGDLAPGSAHARPSAQQRWTKLCNLST